MPKTLKQDLFMRTVSHDIKSIITGLSAYIQLLERQAIKEDNMLLARRVSQITKQINRLTQYVTDMFDIVKIYTHTLALQKEQTNIVMLLQEIIEMQFSVSDTPISSTISGMPRSFLFDSERMRQAIRML